MAGVSNNARVLREMIGQMAALGDESGTCSYVPPPKPPHTPTPPPPPPPASACEEWCEEKCPNKKKKKRCLKWWNLFSLDCHKLFQNHPNLTSWGCFGTLRTSSWRWAQRFFKLMHPGLRDWKKRSAISIYVNCIYLFISLNFPSAISFILLNIKLKFDFLCFCCYSLPEKF